MESGQPRHFSDSFKREAVERVRTSGLTIIEVAEELGLHETVLRRSIRRFDPRETGPARRAIPQAQAPAPCPADLAAENARLKQDLQKAKMERGILKKQYQAGARLCRRETRRAMLGGKRAAAVG